MLPAEFSGSSTCVMFATRVLKPSPGARQLLSRSGGPPPWRVCGRAILSRNQADVPAQRAMRPCPWLSIYEALTLQIELDPCWSMVAGVYLAPHPSVDTSVHELVRYVR